MQRQFLAPFGTVFWMLFGLEGRMTRGQWWFGMALIGAGYFWLIGAIGRYAEHQIGLFPNPMLHERIELIAMLVLIYPALALCQKRLHDRGWGVAGIVILAFLPYAALLGAQLGIADRIGAEFIGELHLHYAVLAVCAYAIVELGMLRGEPCDNPHGADPTAASSTMGVDTASQPTGARPIGANRIGAPVPAMPSLPTDPFRGRVGTIPPALARSLQDQVQVPQ